MRWRGLALAAALCVAACAPRPAAHPALWRIDGPHGERAWLFGTIHALTRPVDWRSPVVDAALAGSDRLVLEVAAIADSQTTARAFDALAQTDPQPPLRSRIAPADVADFDAELAAGRIAPGSLDRYETWAAALILAQAQAARDGQDSGHGIDRALAAAYRGPLAELEGAAAQLAIFDRLPEAQQRRLLTAVLDDDGAARVGHTRDLERAWANGDLAAIERVSSAETFGDPVLREALLVRRNRAWAARLGALLAGGARPFVAVGAAHLVGADGLPALLAARGFTVTRLQ